MTEEEGVVAAAVRPFEISQLKNCHFLHFHIERFNRKLHSIFLKDHLYKLCRLQQLNYCSELCLQDDAGGHGPRLS